MYSKLLHTIESEILHQPIGEDRVSALIKLRNYIKVQLNSNQRVQLNFICTHNSRRSHLAQVWGQTAAAYFQLDQIDCYSGGTEVTAVYTQIIKTLQAQGFEISASNQTNNPKYSIRFSEAVAPFEIFSKKFNDPENPSENFAAIYTCHDAEQACPIVTGANQTISLSFKDPKSADNSNDQSKVYLERSIEIAREIFYIFGGLKKMEDNQGEG